METNDLLARSCKSKSKELVIALYVNGPGIIDVWKHRHILTGENRHQPRLLRLVHLVLLNDDFSCEPVQVVNSLLYLCRKENT